MDHVLNFVDMLGYLSLGEAITISLVSVLSIGIGFATRGVFARIRKTSLDNSRTGKEIATDMLWEYGLSDVDVKKMPGAYTDNYNIKERTVYLSNPVHDGKDALAIAIAAHECGHAVQHDTGYFFLKLRNLVMPVMRFVQSLQVLLFWGALIAFVFTQLSIFLWLIVGIYSVPVVFGIVLLPVEFDASARALRWIKEFDVLTGEEFKKAKKALNWAALTYVINAIGALASMFQIFMLFRKYKK